MCSLAWERLSGISSHDLGFEHAQEIVGRSDLLMQISHQEQIDLNEMLIPVDEYLNSKPIPVSLPINEMAEIDRGPLHRPRNHLTTVISNLVMESFTTYRTGCDPLRR